MEPLVQVAAIPMRRARNGTWQVLLVTTRETQRWVVPKGWPWVDVPNHEAAAREAWEEAGIKGCIQDRACGTFVYDKRRQDNELVPVRVLAYLMEVSEEMEDWPEREQRKRAWFDLDDAVDAVGDCDLKSLLRGLAPS